VQDQDDLSAAVARNVRAARLHRGWTLDQLAARSSVSKGMVVAIEKGRTNPSIQVLSRIADSLGTTLSELVLITDSSSMRLTVAGDGVVLWNGKKGSTATLLIGSHPPFPLEMWQWTIKPSDEYIGEPELPGSLSFLVVHEGTLSLEIGGESALLRPGDSAMLRIDVSRRFANEGTVDVKYCQFFAGVRESAGVDTETGLSSSVPLHSRSLSV
jgi:transcriptional regulator with XRE-family HTH domain